MMIFAAGWSEGLDGPGRRWMIYLKACNFRCRWCASPESLSPEPELLFYPDRAKHMERACPPGAVRLIDGQWRVDRETCVGCKRFCTEVWRHPAFEWAGRELDVSEVVEQVLKRRDFFLPDGGVTFGGGEASLQFEQVLEAIRLLKLEGIHCAVESNASTPGFEALIGEADLLICDLKCVSSDLHKQWTGADNAQVLDNLRRAAGAADELLIRIPLVHGFNDAEEEMARITAFLDELQGAGKGLSVEVFRMHHLGRPKYRALGKVYPMEGVDEADGEKAWKLINEFTSRGLNAWMVNGYHA